MTATARKLPDLITVEEFLARPNDGTGRVVELVEGELRLQEHASDGHGTIQSQVVYLLTAHLNATRPQCRVVTAPGVQPRFRASWNYRVPEIAVTCVAHDPAVRRTPDPLIIVEVLSPSNASDTWDNVRLFMTLPSVVEILALDSERIGGHVLRRDAAGAWPPEPAELCEGDTVRLDAIGLAFPLVEAYRGTSFYRR